jgi:hypothetical protein
MKLILLLAALTISAGAQTINIVHIDANATNIAGISYDHLWLNAAPVCRGSNYTFETETFTWFGEPKWNVVGQFTPQYMAGGCDVWVTNGGCHVFRTRMLVKP